MNRDLTLTTLPPIELLTDGAVTRSIRKTIVIGASVVALSFGVFGTWAAVAPLDSAVVAHGRLAVDSKRKTIQHLEGGIVRQILVKDGDAVTPGQVLLRLDDTKAQSTLDGVQATYYAALAQLARLQAERDGLEAITFPAELTAGQDARVDDILAAQRAQFDERKKSLTAQTSVLDQRIAELNAEIDGHHQQQEALHRQIDLSRKELTGLRELAAKGYYPKNHLLAMERDIARLDGELGSDMAAEARAQKTISETQMEALHVRQAFREQVAKDIDDAQNRANELREQWVAAGDTVHRLEVVAPVAGVVQNIRVATTGGVIGAGQELMDLVPTADKLVIEAEVQPNDIEAVEANQPAEVRFSALKGRNTPVLKATVTTVSADHITDQKTGKSFYETRVEVPADQLARLDGRHIQAGMPVEVMIKGGERTALDYMLRPLFDSISTSLRER